MAEKGDKSELDLLLNFEDEKNDDNDDDKKEKFEFKQINRKRKINFGKRNNSIASSIDKSNSDYNSDNDGDDDIGIVRNLNHFNSKETLESSKYLKSDLRINRLDKSNKSHYLDNNQNFESSMMRPNISNKEENLGKSENNSANHLGIIEKINKKIKKINENDEKTHNITDSHKLHSNQLEKVSSSSESNSEIQRKSAITTNKAVASQVIRQSTVWDYKPDICKDYKETGFCGYGDSCKFIHDRSDYKPGWLIEKEYNDRQEKLRKNLTNNNFEEDNDDQDQNKYYVESSDDEDDDNNTNDREQQEECVICGEKFDFENEKNLVKTQCDHYFHEFCILKRFKRSTKCKICNRETSGILKPLENY